MNLKDYISEHVISRRTRRHMDPEECFERFRKIRFDEMMEMLEKSKSVKYLDGDEVSVMLDNVIEGKWQEIRAEISKSNKILCGDLRVALGDYIFIVTEESLFEIYYSRNADKDHIFRYNLSSGQEDHGTQEEYSMDLMQSLNLWI